MTDSNTDYTTEWKSISITPTSEIYWRIDHEGEVEIFEEDVNGCRSIYLNAELVLRMTDIVKQNRSYL